MSESPELATVAELAAGELGLKKIAFQGKGAFKETYRAQLDGKTVAFKLVDRTKIQLERTEREINALKRCRSKRVAQLLATTVFTAPDQRIFDIVIEEFFDGGTLEDRLEGDSLTDEEVIKLAVGLLLALKELALLRLVHRDIKPANVMFRKGDPEPVLVDFGLVRDLSESSLTASWLPHGPGTPFYASPEQLNNDKGMIDWRSDQFSVGVTIYHILTGQHPYQTEPAIPASAIAAVQARRGPTKECVETLKGLGLEPILEMLAPWPVQRFADPDQAIAALTK